MTGHQTMHLAIQVVRRTVQVLAVAVVLALVFTSLYSHYRAARALEDEDLMSGWRGAVLGTIDRLVGPMEDPQALLDGWKGTFWSARIAGVSLTDPLAAAEMTAAARTLHGALYLSILLPVILTLLLGRVFCSWICPAYLLFEITGKLRGLLGLAELPPPRIEFSYYNKYWFLGVGLVAAALTGLPFFALIYPPAMLSRMAHAWIFGAGLTGTALLLLLIVAFEVSVSPRWWCRTMCPGGALYGLLGWPRLLRVRLDADRCTRCRECEPVCEEGLNPVLESYGMECDNCGVCIRHCPEKALLFTLGLPKRSNRASRAGKGMAPNGFRMAGWLLLAALLAPAPATAHHILGLPHYAYKENYPQAPVLEYPATAGPYDILLTSYPGNPIPGEAANLAFYIKDRRTGRPYDRPVNVRVYQTLSFGRTREILPITECRSFDNLFKVSVTFMEDGEHVVELSMEVEGATERIPFLMVAGNPASGGGILMAGAALGFLLFLVTVRAVKIKRRRRAHTAAAAAAG